MQRIISAALAAIALSVSAGVAGAQTYDARIVKDIEGGYFDRTYKGKPFSDVGEVDAYARRTSFFGPAAPTSD